MKRVFITAFCLMTGGVALAESGLAAQWSAARRAPRSAAAGPRGEETAAPVVSVENVTESEFAKPDRPWRCSPAPLIRRPGWREAAPETAVPPPAAKAAPPVEPKAQITPRTTPAPAPPAPAVAAPAPPKTPAASSYGKVPPYFIRNDGQIDEVVRYYVKGPRGTVYLTDAEIVFDFLQENPSEDDGEEPDEEPGRPGPEREKEKSFTRLVFRQQFVEPNPKVSLGGEKELPGKINYFVGSRSTWRSNIPTVEEVFYYDLYDGIDLKCYFEGATIRNRYTIRPGADPGRLVLRYIGVDGLEIKPSGDLIVLTPFGGFVTRAPKAYQEIDGKRVEVESAFKLGDDEAVALEIGSYDSTVPLIIE